MTILSMYFFKFSIWLEGLANYHILLYLFYISSQLFWNQELSRVLTAFSLLWFALRMLGLHGRVHTAV